VYLVGLFNNNKVRITSILRGSDEVTSHLAPFSVPGFIVRRLEDTNNENTTLPNAETFKNTWRAAVGYSGAAEANSISYPRTV